MAVVSQFTVMRVRVYMRVCTRAHVSVCVCTRPCVRVRLCVIVCVCVCVFVRVCAYQTQISDNV